MDAFEAIRQKASHLYERAVGDNPTLLPSMDIVQAAIADLELELCWLPSGDPALKGARALYDEQSGTILAEDEGDLVTRAQIVAHEIGHAVIHTGSSSCTTHDLDPSRSTEAAPVGLQRVEDYGAHERRELQANVFARELLLPRSLARRLFVEDKLSAAELCERTQLPAALVRQQIFDEILLPPPGAIDNDALPESLEREDKVQDAAASHRGSPFKLEAGPGTGKTRTLVKRIHSLLDEGVDPSSILVLTFSNRAAGELSERISATSPENAAKIWIGTFHAFGLDIVRRHYDLLDLPPDPALFDRSDAISVLEEILPTLPLSHYRNLWDPAIVLKEVLNAISRAKDELVNHEEYRALAEAMLDGGGGERAAEAAEKCLEVANIYERYERAKTSRGSLDFGDIIMRPTLLLESNASVRASVQLRHRHVLVDEYQDVNRASVRLVKAIAGSGERLWIVGDARQSIYRFRGASAINMANFAMDFEGAKSDKLQINYRSTKQIVDTFCALAPHMGASRGMLPLELTADRESGPAPPDLRCFDTLEDEAAGIAASIRELESSGVPLRDQAVLVRTNSRLGEIGAELEARGIPVLHLGSLFERDEVRDLLALMSLAVDRFGDSLVRVAAMPRYDVSIQDIFLALKGLRGGNRLALARLDTLPAIAGISEQAAAGFSRLAKDLESMSSSISGWDFLATYLLDRTDIGRTLAEAETVSARMRNVAIWQFLNFLREQPVVGHGPPIQRSLDRVRQLVLLAEERDLRQVPPSALHMNAVRLMTVHGSKGLEFEAVHLPGLTQASFPLSYRGQRCPPPAGLIAGAADQSVDDHAKQSHAEEEECLFFVALSRAKTHLRLYQTRLQRGGAKRRSPSVLLEAIPRHLIHETDDPPKIPLPLGVLDLPAIEVTYSQERSVTDKSLDLYLKCRRRFFYTHVLGLGSAKKATAFSRTHECLYETIRWLSKERLSGEPGLKDAEAEFEKIWEERGPGDHAFASDYRNLASRLIVALVDSGAGKSFREAKPLALDLANGRVIVEPNEMAELPDGTVILRRVRTGYKRSKEYDNLEYSLYLLAGQAHFGDGYEVEAVHLTDGIVEGVSVTPTKIKNRKGTADSMLAGINSGEFPPTVDAVTCPRCPHFFVCPSAPKGRLTITD